MCGLITPWNFPLLMTSFKMAPMLASGSTAVFKPPKLAPLSSLKIADIWTNIDGSVPGVVNMLPGVGKEAGDAIVGHPNVNLIDFTGSTEVGKKIMARASRTLKRVKLRLGGKSPLIVFDDANLNRTTNIAGINGCLNSG